MTSGIAGNNPIKEFNRNNRGDLYFDVGIEKSSSAIGLLFSCVLIVSIAYNYCYFQIIGPEYFNILSTIDYAKSAVRVLPYAVVWLLIVIFAGMIVKVIPARGFFAKKHKISWYKNFFYIYCLITNLIVVAFIWRNGEFSNQVRVLLGAMVALEFLYAVYMEMISRKILPVILDSLQVSIFTLIVMSIAASAQGLLDADSHMNDHAHSYDISSTAGTGGPIKASVYRMIEKGVLFEDISLKKIIFMPWDNIKQTQSVKTIVP